MELLKIVAGFLGTALVVMLAGTRLARHGDAIAARTRLGGLWVGAVFVAVATSLPELVTDVAAIRMGAADVAVGDLFGSNMANMLILAVVSLVPGSDLFRAVAIDNALSASLAIALTAAAAMFALARPDTTLLGVELAPLVLALAYLAGIRAVFRHSVLARVATTVEETAAADGGASSEPAPSGRAAVRGFLFAAAMIVLAAPPFAHFAKELAAATGLATSFVGTTLVALTTSLPELVTSFAALRLRAYDLVVGNLFGSNAFNMALFLALSLAHPGAPLFAGLAPVHALSALASIVLMGIGLAAIVYRARRETSALEPASVLMIVVYVVSIALVYARGGAH